MAETELIEPAPVGHNLPDKFDLIREQIDDLYTEAQHWLDGEEIDNEQSAEAIGKLLKMLRDAGKEAKTAHDIDKAPHREMATAVDDRYRPLTSRVQLATDACKKALAPWLTKKEQAQEAEAARLREIAYAKAREAREAQEASAAAPPSDLAARAAAEERTEEAKHAENKAKYAEKQRPTTKGGSGRAVSLRTKRRPVLEDPVEAARFFWKRERKEMESFLTTLAEQYVRANKPVEGFEIIEEKSAV